MKQVTLFYRSQDGKDDYRFCFEKQTNGEWRIYVLNHPSYGKASQSPYATHCLYDQKGKFVSWHEPIQTLEEAKQIAVFWAEETQHYIKEGDHNEKKHRQKDCRRIHPMHGDDDNGALEYY